MKSNTAIYELIAAWTIFCLIHSLFASLGFKSFIRERSKFLVRYFEIFYVAQSLILFFAVGYFYVQAGGARSDLEVIYSVPLPYYLNYVLAAAAFFMVAFTRISARSIVMSGRSEEEDESSSDGSKEINPLIKTGPYRISRHPMYLFITIGLIFLPMTQPQLISALFIIGYFYFGCFLEERKLIAEFGDEYRDYQKSVSRFFPFKLLMRK